MTEYESREDFKRQQAIELIIEKHWMCEVRRIPYEYVQDNVLIRGGKVLAFSEIKCRNQRWAEWPTVIISLNKVMMAQHLYNCTGLSTYFVVATNDGLVHWTKMNRAFDYVIPGPKKNPRPKDGHEVEPCCTIPCEEFAPLASELIEQR